MSKAAFVDESFSDTRANQAGFYQLTAAVIDSADISGFRAGLARIAPAGFDPSSVATAKQFSLITDVLAFVATEIGWNIITVATTTSRNMEPARQRCLSNLLSELDKQPSSRHPQSFWTAGKTLGPARTRNT